MGHLLDKRGRGRPKKSYLEDNKHPMQIGNYCDMKRNVPFYICNLMF